MKRWASIAAAVVAGVAWATPARADNEQNVQGAMDRYLANQPADASLVGGAGSAGYDAGFWIRGGDFDLKINLTIQARFEAFDWDLVEPTPGGDLSGWSLPRATVKFSGHAPCNICYYMEMDYGHFGSDVARLRNPSTNVNLPPVAVPPPAVNNFNLGPTRYGLNPVDFQSRNYENTREAWIEWCPCPTFNFRMGQILTPNTRQLMTAPELQQFVDISLASAFTGHLMSGYTDRNRDHGVMVHGALGCNGDWQYMVAITNGDGGDSIRNVLDNRTDDNIAASGRLNWSFLAPIYYEEGALRQKTCTWYGEVGAWAYYYADRLDKPHRKAHRQLCSARRLRVRRWSPTPIAHAGCDESLGSGLY